MCENRNKESNRVFCNSYEVVNFHQQENAKKANHMDRRHAIVELLRVNGSVKVAELAKQYDVGEPTIRRDLKELKKKHPIKITYGGAMMDSTVDLFQGDASKRDMEEIPFLENKIVIARKAAGLIDHGDTIAFNSGYTAKLILNHLEEDKKIIVTTLSIDVAMKASEMPNVTLYMPGGMMEDKTRTFYGKETETFLSKLNIDKVFFDPYGVSIAGGVTHLAIEGVSASRMLLDISSQKYLIGDHARYEKKTLVSLADLNEFDALITDDQLDDTYKKYAEDNGIEII